MTTFSVRQVRLDCGIFESLGQQQSRRFLSNSVEDEILILNVSEACDVLASVCTCTRGAKKTIEWYIIFLSPRGKNARRFYSWPPK